MLARILIVFAICLSLVSCKSLVEKYKRSSGGVAAVDKKVLFDFRQAPAMRLAKDSACTPAPAACSTIIGEDDGSFTYAAENEHACFYRCASGNKLQIFSKQKLQASADTPFSNIIGKFDLNRDDKNELLLMDETTKAGVVDREASLVDFEKNSLHTVEDFGIVYHNPCALFADAGDAQRRQLVAGGRSPFVEAVVIWYLPHPEHQMPSFTVQRYRAPCPAGAGAAPTGWSLIVK